jgi:hypothetical protein
MGEKELRAINDWKERAFSERRSLPFMTSDTINIASGK